MNVPHTVVCGGVGGLVNSRERRKDRKLDGSDCDRGIWQAPYDAVHCSRSIQTRGGGEAAKNGWGGRQAKAKVELPRGANAGGEKKRRAPGGGLFNEPLAKGKKPLGGGKGSGAMWRGGT